MTAIEEFEIRAKAFRLMTGYLAPGKDCRQHDPEVRRAAWEVWIKVYGPCVDAVMTACSDILPNEE